MSLVISDRVKETTTTQGTGTVTLGGPLGGFQSFSSAIGSGNTTYYVIENDTQFEIGIGTCGGDSLSRDTVLRSSSGGAKISLSGVSFVFCAIPADRSMFKDEDGDFVISGDISIDDLFADGSIVVKDNIHASGNISTDGDISAGDISAGSVSVADLSTSGNIIVNDLRASGQILSSGLLTLVRTGAGSFAHAFVDGNNQTIALHTDGGTSPEWKLGLKTDQSETAAPTVAYIVAKDGDIGFYANSSNHLDLDHGNGFIITNQGDTTFVSSSATGNYAIGNTAAYPSFVVKGAISQSDNIQEWQNSSELTLASVSNDGSIHTSGNISASGGILLNDVVPNSITNKLYNDGGSLFFGGSPLGGDAKNVDVLANSASGVAISGYIDHVAGSGSDLTISSGNANLALINANTTEMRAADEANAASGVAISGWADSTFLTSAPNANEVEANSASGVAISGWASYTIDATGLYVRGLALENEIEIRTNSASGVAISGWAAYKVDANSALISDNTTHVHDLETSGNVLESEIRTNSASGVAISGYNQDYTDIKIAALIDSAPSTLDTLNEIAIALSGDPSLAVNLTNEIRANSASGNRLEADIRANSASGIGTPSGVAFFGADGSTTDVTGFIVKSGEVNTQVAIGGSYSNIASQLYPQLAVYNNQQHQQAAVNIENNAFGNAILNIVATSGSRSAGIKMSQGADWYCGPHQASMAGLGQRFVVAAKDLDPTYAVVVDTVGRLVVGGVSPIAQLTVDNKTASYPVSVFKGAASQSANLTEWRDSAGDVLSSIDSNGSLSIASGNIHVYNPSISGINDTNYERLELTWDSNIGYLRTETDGTGATNRRIYIKGDYEVRMQTSVGNSWIFGQNTSTTYSTNVNPGVDSHTELGRTDYRWENIYTDIITVGDGADAVVANTSGLLVGSGDIHVYNPSASGINDTNYERIELLFDSNVGYVKPTAAGDGTVREIRLGDSDDYFRASPAINQIAGFAGGNTLFVGLSTQIQFYKSILPNNDGAASLGIDAKRWNHTLTHELTVGEGVDTVLANSSGITIDGQAPATSPFTVQGAASQSANLTEWQNNSDVVLASVDNEGSLSIGSGNIYVYNPSISGINDTNYERLEIGFDSNVAKIKAANNGTGSSRVLTLDSSSQVNLKYNNSNRLRVGSSAITLYNTLSPSTDLNSNIGETNKRFNKGFIKEITASELDIQPAAATDVGITVQGAVSQTANLQEWQNSAGDVLAHVDSGGGILVSGDATVSGTLFTPIIKGQVYFKNGASNHIIVDASEAGTNNATLTTRGNRFIITAEDGFGNNLGELWLNGIGGTYLRHDSDTKLSTTNSGVTINNSLDIIGSSGVFVLYGLNETNDYERLKIGVEDNQFCIVPEASGAGTKRELYLGSPDTDIVTTFHGSLETHDSNSQIKLGGGALNLGNKALLRWNSTHAEIIEYFNSNIGQQQWYTDGSIRFFGDSRTDPAEVHFYNDYTDTSNYGRLEIAGDGTDYIIKAANDGTGSQGNTILRAGAATTIPSVIQGAASQSADLTQWQHSSDQVLAKMDSSGVFTQILGSSGTDVSRLIFGDSERGQTAADQNVTGVWLDYEDGSLYNNGGLIFGTWYNTAKTAKTYLQIEKDYLRFEIGNGLRLITTTTATRINGNLEPYSSLTNDLGKFNLPWLNIYGQNVHVSGSLFASGDPGTAGQVLTSTVNGVEWSDPQSTVSGIPSGVAFFGEDGLLNYGQDPDLLWGSGDNQLIFKNTNGKIVFDPDADNVQIGQYGTAPAIEFKINGVRTHVFRGNSFIGLERDGVVEFNDSNNSAAIALGQGDTQLWNTPVGGELAVRNYRSNNLNNPASFNVYHSVDVSSDTTKLTEFERLTILASGDDSAPQYIIKPQYGTTSGNPGSLYVQNQSVTVPAFIVQGGVSQSASLQEWQDSNSDLLASVDNAGNLYASGNVTTSGALVFERGNVTNTYIDDIGSSTFRYYASYHLFRSGSHGVNFRLGNSAQGGITTSPGHGYGIASSAITSASVTPDVVLHREDAAHFRISDREAKSSSNLGQLTASGINVSGVFLGDFVPANTSQTLYNDGGTLKFNGSAVGGGGSSLTAGSGITIQDDTINVFGVSGQLNGLVLVEDGSNRPLNVLVDDVEKAHINHNGDFSNNQVSTNLQAEAFGSGAEVHGSYATALGARTYASGANAPLSIGALSVAAGTANISIGYSAGRNVSGTGNDTYSVRIGASAGKEGRDTDRVTMVGGLFCGTESSGDYLTFLGSYAGYYASGSNNVGIGLSALREVVGTGNVEIRRKDTFTSSDIGTANSKLNIDTLIRGDFDAGKVGINNADFSFDGAFNVSTGGSSKKGVVVQGAASQSANLQEWQNSSSVVSAEIDHQGQFLTSGNIVIASGSLGVGTTDPAEKVEIKNGSLRMTTDYGVEWGGGNNRIRGNSGGVGSGKIRVYAGSYVVGHFDGAAAGGTGGLTVGGDQSTDYKLEVLGSGAMNGIASSGNVVIDGNITLGSSGTLISSGINVSGINLGNHVPVNTTNALYNEGGTLKFNGSAVGGGGGTTYTAGSGLILQDDVFHLSFGSGNVNRDYTTAVSGYLDFAIASGADFTISSGQKAYDLAVAVAINSGNLNDAAIDALTVQLRTESASGAIHAADILANSASGVGSPSGLAFFGGGPAVSDNGHLTHSANLVIESGQNRIQMHPPGADEVVKIGWNADRDEFLINSVANGGTARNVVMAVGGTAVFTMNAAQSKMVVAGDLDPDNDAQRELGSSSRRFANIYTDQLNAHCHTASDVCIQVKAHASQSANVQSWRTNGGTEFVGIGPDGGIVLPDNTPSSTTNKLYNNGGTLTFNGSAVGGGGGMSNFILEDDSGDEVTISDGKEVKFIGDGVTINWTDTSDGSDSDPYDLTFTLDTVSVAKGGTNATSFADKSVIISQDSGTDTLAAAQMDGNGELLIGGTSGPAVATLSSPLGSIAITNGDGTIQLESGGPSPSDEKLKENVEELQNCLEKVEKLCPVSFDWNALAFEEFKREGSDIGLIAQDVEKICPEAIGDNKNFKGVDYAKLTVLLIKALKELKQEVENLKTDLN